MNATPDVKYLGFDALQEPWNIYKLSDGTILKVRFLLQKVRVEKDKEGARLTFASSNLAIVEVPEKLRGRPGPLASMEQIDRAIVEPELNAEPLKETETIYSLSDGSLMKVKTDLVRVGRTSLFNPEGDPIYKVDTSHEVLFLQATPPDKAHILGP